MRKLLTLITAVILTAAVNFAQAPNPAFKAWFNEFRASVAKRDGKAIAAMTYCPTEWQLGRLRVLEKREDLVQKFDTYFPDDMRQAIATQEPKFSNDYYLLAFHRGKKEFTLYFKSDGKGSFQLDSVGDGSN